MHFYYPKDKELSLEKALSMEWLETNGLGSYASSTVINCHTRKYHGLLVSKLDGLSDKYVLLNKFEDVLIQDGTENFLTAHLYPDCFQDGSFANFQDFKLTTNPIWNFKFTNLTLTKEILMVYGENTVLFKYTATGEKNFKIVLRPLFSYRNFHQLQHENSDLQQRIEYFPNGFGYTPYADMPEIFFETDVPHEFLVQPLWYRNFIYSKEKARGYGCAEDLFSPGIIVIESKAEGEIICACGMSKHKENLQNKWQKELDRRQKNIMKFDNATLKGQLHKVAQSFITEKVERVESQTSEAIVAGYHWFMEWGRDAMISLPGLTLYSGQEDQCLAILRNFASQEYRGLIPNYLGTTKETNAYNTVDASLWFGWAVQQYYLKTKNLEVIEMYFWQVFKNIFEFYKNGTIYNIKMQKNGLLFSGNAETNLTWMDAMVDGKPVIPRYGYQVEVNALWFNMLGFMEELAQSLQDPIQHELHQLLSLTKSTFCQTFWCEEKGYLYDYVNNEQKNSALRPNQIFAVSLAYSPLSFNIAAGIMAVVKEKLLTPYGLRTLAEDDIGYIGLYEGNQSKRDYAYHNGTVWPWLLGHFAEALLKVTSEQQEVVAIMTPCLEALQKHLAVYGLGSIAEIFSGDYPHYPDGCISQAWSVAEVLRLTYLLYR